MKIEKDKKDDRVNGFYGYLTDFTYKYIYVEAESDSVFIINYSYSKDQVQELNEGELISSYFMADQMGTKNFKF